MRHALCALPDSFPFSAIGHGHTQTNTDGKTLYKISVRVRLCGSVAILTAHKFQSHVSYLLIFPTSHPLSFPQSQIPNRKISSSLSLVFFPPSHLPIFPTSAVSSSFPIQNSMLDVRCSMFIFSVPSIPPSHLPTLFFSTFPPSFFPPSAFPIPPSIPPYLPALASELQVVLNAVIIRQSSNT